MTTWVGDLFFSITRLGLGVVLHPYPLTGPGIDAAGVVTSLHPDMALNSTINSLSTELRKVKRTVQDGMEKVSRAVTEQTSRAVTKVTTQIKTLGKKLTTMTKEEAKMAMMTVALATVMVLLPGMFRHVKLSMRLPARRGLQLPKGSLGLPFVGESINLKTQQQTFYNNRRKWYGDLFRTHLFGYPSIVVTDPEAAKYVLVDQSVLFKQLPLPEVEKILGSKCFGYQNHRVHARLRTVMQSPLLALHNAIPYIEALALGLMYSWEGRTVNALYEIHHYTFDVATHFIIGAQPKEQLEALRQACNNMFSGVRAWPINLIGTNFWWAKRGRSQACAIIDSIIAERRSEGCPHGDVLGALMDAEDDQGVRITREELHDNILTLLFDARDTAAAALTWTLKNLSDHPELLKEVTVEHDKIRHKKLPPESVPLQWSDIKDMPLTWADIKEMPLTLRVIKETLRLGNLVDFSYREALEDVEYEDFFFPKGWRVLVVHANFHLNPDYFPDPLQFDPSRFEVVLVIVMNGKIVMNDSRRYSSVLCFRVHQDKERSHRLVMVLMSALAESWLSWRYSFSSTTLPLDSCGPLPALSLARFTGRYEYQEAGCQFLSPASRRNITFATLNFADTSRLALAASSGAVSASDGRNT